MLLSISSNSLPLRLRSWLASETLFSVEFEDLPVILEDIDMVSLLPLDEDEGKWCRTTFLASLMIMSRYCLNAPWMSFDRSKPWTIASRVLRISLSSSRYELLTGRVSVRSRILPMRCRVSVNVTTEITYKQVSKAPRKALTNASTQHPQWCAQVV